MTKYAAFALTCLIAGGTAGVSPASAETRQVEAHQHGTTEVEIAIEAGLVSMALHAPGADIVGFEYSPKSEQDKAAVAAAIGLLSQPQQLFTFPEDAGCGVTSATVALEGDDAHGHGHGHGHGHDHAAQHLEFSAQYTFACTDSAAIDTIGLPYSALFPGAQKIDFDILSDAGAQAYSATRGQTGLSLRGGS